MFSKKALFMMVIAMSAGAMNADVGDLLPLIADVPHEPAQAEAEGQEVEEGLQQRRDEADLPALPVDGRGSAARRG